MSDLGPPLFYKNELKLPEINQTSLEILLHTFESATQKGIDLILSKSPGPDSTSDIAYGNIFTGELGKIQHSTASPSRVHFDWFARDHFTILC